MNGLTRFLDWLDEAAAGFIRLAYLLAGITAVALYFGAGHLPVIIEDPLNGALPWCLAAAVETHTYITARRVRAAWQERNWAALKVNLAILAGLLAFSAWNQLNYLADTWQPPAGALALPSWLAYGVRALIVPCAFMAAAFLAPLAEPVTAQIEAEARATLADVFKIARKQRRRMLRDAERDGRDMTGALVELVPDPETRRIISHAYNAIGAPVQPLAMIAPLMVDATPALSDLRTDALVEAPGDDSTRPPTGPGSRTRKRGVRTPTIDDASGVPSGDAGDRSNVTRLPSPNSRPRRQSAARNRTSGRSKGSRAKGRNNVSVQDRARQAWQPGMSVAALRDAASISHGSAQKYRAMLTAEAAAMPAQVAVR